MTLLLLLPQRHLVVTLHAALLGADGQMWSYFESRELSVNMDAAANSPATLRAAM